MRVSYQTVLALMPCKGLTRNNLIACALRDIIIRPTEGKPGNEAMYKLLNNYLQFISRMIAITHARSTSVWSTDHFLTYISIQPGA